MGENWAPWFFYDYYYASWELNHSFVHRMVVILSTYECTYEWKVYKPLGSNEWFTCELRHSGKLFGKIQLTKNFIFCLYFVCLLLCILPSYYFQCKYDKFYTMKMIVCGLLHCFVLLLRICNEKCVQIMFQNLTVFCLSRDRSSLHIKAVCLSSKGISWVVSTILMLCFSWELRQSVTVSIGHIYIKVRTSVFSLCMDSC